MKERLTGAIILVALMVLLVPELLTGPIRTKSAPAAPAAAASAPPAPAGGPAQAAPPLRTYTLTLGAAPQAQETAAAAAAQATPAQSSPESPTPPAAQEPARSDSPAQGTGAAEAAPDARAPGPARQGTSAGPGLQVAKTPAHPAVREATSSASSRGWVVQLGSFADRQNAVRLAHSLQAKGFRMSVSPARAGSRVLWRVRTAPHDRGGAEHLAARLRALGHRGELLPVR